MKVLKTMRLLKIILSICFCFVSNTIGDSFAADKSGMVSVGNPTGRGESFSFIVWGHSKRGDGVPVVHFEEILDRIAELKVDFLVITGDVINGMWGKRVDPEVIRSDWERFDEGVNKLGIPVYRLPGNHDVHNFATRDIYLERYTRPPFAFTYKGCRFILLDTVGIDQRAEDGIPQWKPQELPFDDAQLTFIRNEIEHQDSYKHVFFFMHHVMRWRDPSGLWWRDVHPMLKGGKTRAVFSGTPGNPAYKYDHIEQDGIHYIDSCTFPSYSVNKYKLYKRLGVLEETVALDHQPDNLQFVRVEGDKYTIRTIVVGEWNTPSLSSRLWLKVEQPLGIREHLRYYIHEVFKTFRRFSLSHVIWGAGGLIAGVLIFFFWQRWRMR